MTFSRLVGASCGGRLFARSARAILR